MRDVNLSFMATVTETVNISIIPAWIIIIEDFFWNTLSVFVMFLWIFFVMFHFLKLH